MAIMSTTTIAHGVTGEMAIIGTTAIATLGEIGKITIIIGITGTIGAMLPDIGYFGLTSNQNPSWNGAIKF